MADIIPVTWAGCQLSEGSIISVQKNFDEVIIDATLSKHSYANNVVINVQNISAESLMKIGITTSSSGYNSVALTLSQNKTETVSKDMFPLEISHKQLNFRYDVHHSKADLSEVLKNAD